MGGSYSTGFLGELLVFIYGEADICGGFAKLFVFFHRRLPRILASILGQVGVRNMAWLGLQVGSAAQEFSDATGLRNSSAEIATPAERMFLEGCVPYRCFPRSEETRTHNLTLDEIFNGFLAKSGKAKQKITRKNKPSKLCKTCD